MLTRSSGEAVLERRRCRCGCRRRATHHGMLGTVHVVFGCEQFVARWVEDPSATLAAVLVKRRRRR